MNSEWAQNSSLRYATLRPVEKPIIHSPCKPSDVYRTRSLMIGDDKLVIAKVISCVTYVYVAGINILMNFSGNSSNPVAFDLIECSAKVTSSSFTFVNARFSKEWFVGSRETLHRNHLRKEMTQCANCMTGHDELKIYFQKKNIAIESINLHFDIAEIASSVVCEYCRS